MHLLLKNTCKGMFTIFMHCTLDVFVSALNLMLKKLNYSI